MGLQISGLCAVQAGHTLLHPLNLTINRGELMVVLGPSGSGKSTLLRLLMGIQVAAAGQIRLAGCHIETLPPERRDVAMMFQNHALFPHLNVRGNLLFGLRMKQVPRDEQNRRLEECVTMCRIESLLERMPHQLSGGQQQRVAIARAIMMQPALLLLDEPLSQLDAELRIQLRAELRDLQRRLALTCLYVTHDQEDAMMLGDRIVLLERGQVVEVGTPQALYKQAKTAFTARFLGQAQVFHVSRPIDQPTHAILPWGGTARLDEVGHKTQVQVMLRPEDLALTPHPEGVGVIEDKNYLGSSTLYTVRVAHQIWQARVANIGHTPSALDVGMRVNLHPQEPLHVLTD